MKKKDIFLTFFVIFLIYTSNKITMSDIIKRLEKSAFVNTMLSKLSSHFYKSHNSILEILK